MSDHTEPDPLNLEAERLRALMHERGFKTVAALATAMGVNRSRIDLALKGGSENCQRQMREFLEGADQCEATPEAAPPRRPRPRPQITESGEDEADLVAAYRDFRTAQQAAKEALERIRAILGVALEVAA